MFELPYNSMDEATKDGFAKIGGKDGALRCLAAGWYQVNYRKKMNMQRSALLEAAKKDPRFKDLVSASKKQAAAIGK